MDGFACITSIIFAVGFFFAIQLLLDAVIRKLRDDLNDEWITEGRPAAMLSMEALKFSPAKEMARLGLHWRLLFNSPAWVKRGANIYRRVIQFRALHVGLVVYLILVVLFDAILKRIQVP